MFAARDLALLAPVWREQRPETEEPGQASAAPRLHPVAEPCTLHSANGRVRDGMMRHAGPAGAVVAGVGGLGLGQDVVLVLPRRNGLRMRARVAGLGVMGLLLDLMPADCGPDWRRALLGMTEPGWGAA